MTENLKNEKVRASRDGDQFHYLWAARKCLALIPPGAPLIAIAIEGASTFESAQSGLENGDEVVDVAEYYGSQDLALARCVRYTQLKHSTQQVDKPWTFSGLEATLSGFSAKFREIQARSDSSAVLPKLQFAFFSNRPVSDAVLALVAELAGETPVQDASLQTKLERVTKLAIADLRSFCRQIQFEAGQPDYWNQRNLLAQEVAGYLPGNDVDAPIQLKELVTKKALSESGKDNVITRIDVLRTLKTDEIKLFPAPCRLQVPASVIRRTQTPALVKTIINANSVPVVIHADAGVGKSVFALTIGENLPAGSVTVLYDCFGDGEYRSVSGYRHRHRDAAVQIANELASKSLCHPLLQAPYADGSDYINALLYRLKQAISGIRARLPEAILAVVVDAADNAEMAAKELGETRSFVVDLIRAPIPDGVRLVFLCRTHRRNFLKAPHSTEKGELTAFDLEETRSFLIRKFPAATIADIRAFHRLSSHNPRVQALALSQDGTLGEILLSLGPTPTTVSAALASLLSKAVEKVRDEAGDIGEGEIDSICAGLATLRPLVPIRVLSAISGVSDSAIRSFAFDLGRPLFVSGDLIHFLDEPCESWFRETYKPTGRLLTKFITSLRPLATSDPYVAAVLPQLMLEAGQLRQLIALALSSADLPDDSPIERRDVEMRRLQFALKASLRGKRWLDASKLALKAGGETAGDKRQTAIIQHNTDLAARFLSTDRVQELVSRRTFESSWLGSNNCYEAGIMSHKDSLRVEVLSRLRMAQEWMESLFRMPQEERSKGIEYEDIAEIAMAILNVRGPTACADFLSGWEPKEVEFRVGRLLGSRLIDLGRFQELHDIADKSRKICVALAVNDELSHVGQTCSRRSLRKIVRVLSLDRVTVKTKTFDYRESLLGVIASVVAAAAQIGVRKQTLTMILDRYLPDQPPSNLGSQFASGHAPYLKARCLRAALADTTLALDDLADPKLRERLRSGNYDGTRETRNFKDIIGRLFPWHQLYADACAGRMESSQLVKRIEEAGVASAQTDTYYEDERFVADEVSLLWLATLAVSKGLTTEALDNFEHWRKSLKRPLSPPTLRTLARFLARACPSSHLALMYAHSAYEVSEDLREDASSKSSELVHLARAVLPLSEAEAHAYFDKAVAVAGRIGDENLERWGAMLDLAERAGDQTRADAQLAYRLSRCAELTYQYVDRDKHFPWSDTIESIVRLCPASSLATFSRWRDRRFGNRGRIFARAVKALINASALGGALAIPLVTIRSWWDIKTLFGNAIADLRAPQRQRACEFYLRYMLLDDHEESDWQAIKEVITAHDLSINELQDVIEIKCRQAADPNRGRTTSSTAEADQDSCGWESIFRDLQLTNATEIAAAITRYRETDPPWDWEGFYARLFLRTPAGQEPMVLKALAELPDVSLYGWREILGVMPDNWKSRLAIKSTLANIIKAGYARHSMEMASSRYFQPLPIDLACRVSGLSEAVLVRTVVEAIGDLPDQLDASHLFTLAGLLAKLLKPTEAAASLSYGLDLFEPTLKDSDGDGPWKPSFAPSNDVDASLAGYLWAGLASPVASIRWESAHAVRALCYFDRQEILKPLIRLARTKFGGNFADARLHFYDLHGLQWLLIALAQAAMSSPNAVKPHVAFLKEQICRPDRHVLIRQFARDALLALHSQGKLVLAQSKVEELTRINCADRKPRKSAGHGRRNTTPEGREDDFHFGIDIGPYWFAPLGRLFGKSELEISRNVAKIIEQDWGLPKIERWDEDKRHALNIFDSDTTHSHGSSPKTDDLRFYLAYHGMMIVAGNLLKSASPIVNRDWEGGSVADWIKGHSLTRRDGRWLADRRDPAPLDKPSWKEANDDEAWRWSIRRDDFSGILSPSADTMTVWGDWTNVLHDRVEQICVSSALVSPATAPALLNCLQTTNPLRYHIPAAEDDSEIDQPGFELTGWIDNDTVSAGLDGLDPWAGGIRYPGLQPAESAKAALSLVSDVDGRIWRNTTAEVARSTVWARTAEGEREEWKENGRRLVCSMESLRKFLAVAGKELVVSVTVRRSYSGSYRKPTNDFERYPPDYARIFTLSATGPIRSL